MKRHFDFDDVRLLPKKGIVSSRDSCDTSVKLGNHTFKLGIVPANMICTIDENLAISLSQNNYFYIHHRFNHNNIDFIRKMNNKGLVSSISIGVNSDSYQQIQQIQNENLKVDFITVDIAHGHSEKLESMVKFIKEAIPDTFVIGGNVCTEEAVMDLESWGCDAIKAGIGPGLSCETYKITNVGSRGWQAAMIQNLVKVATKPIICDGGIRSIGHACVSFALGSHFTMIGGLLSSFTDSPGDQITGLDGKEYKEFFGSASEFTKGHKKYVEGKKLLVEAKNQSLLDYLDNDFSHGIKSCISYLGGKDMSAFIAADHIVL